MTHSINFHLSRYFLILLILLASTAKATNSCNLNDIAAPLYQTESLIKQYQLDNGLTVSLLPISERNSVSLASHFQVGSADEIAGQTGYAHLFEHLLFKGSKHAPADSYSRQLKAIGANFNASTHFDYTNYYVRLPAEGTQLALFLEADRFINPVLSATTLKNQQAAVLEEMAISIDNQPYVRKAMNFLLQQVADTPYGHAIIGSKTDINNASTDKLNQFHQTHYQPNKLHLVIVGKISEQTEGWISHYFSHWQTNSKNSAMAKLTAKSLPRPIQLSKQASYGEIIDERGPWPGLLLAWHTVAEIHPDAAAVKLLEAHLFQNKASLLKQASLTDPNHLLSYSLPFPMARHGIANLVMIPRARASLDVLAEAIQTSIEHVTNMGLSTMALCQLKQNWLTQQLSLLNHDQTLAKHLAARKQFDKPLTKQWEQINQVTQEDLQRVAAKYFSDKVIRLDLLPPWYIRWMKSITETLPSSWSDSLERAIL